MSEKIDTDSAVSDSLLPSAHLTSTPHASCAVDRRQLKETGIERALELTVSTIIKSKDSEFSIDEATAVGWCSDSHGRWVVFGQPRLLGGVRTATAVGWRSDSHGRWVAFGHKARNAHDTTSFNL